MCYQRSECYFVRKFYLFSCLRNINDIILSESLRCEHQRNGFVYDDGNLKEFCSRNGRAFQRFSKFHAACLNND